jgi:Raf kinase inhibitor-like YbhB/YbcL family protein
MKIICPEFHHGGTIPRIYTCDGEDINPELSITEIPAEAKTLALIVDDPDAPGRTWVHWVVFNMTTDGTVRRNSIPGTEGQNDFGRLSYGGPCPPRGAHRYYFKVYALDARLDLREGSTKAELLKAMKGRILEEASLIGLYSRS